MNIERRKGQVEVGQRRKNHRETFTVYEIEGDRATVCQTVQVDPVNGYVHKGGDCCWESVSVLEDCELLADAPPEPAKSCICPHGPRTTDGKCPIHVTAGIPVSGFADCACAKCSPPAQEAPKAAPVCQAATGNCPDAPKTRVILDYIRKNPIRVEWCDPCALAYERAHVTSASTGKPYAGPERLPRPQLAADWVEDCLPEGDR